MRKQPTAKTATERKFDMAALNAVAKEAAKSKRRDKREHINGY